jgi:exodeoxyribonuclease V alpha subunit
MEINDAVNYVAMNNQVEDYFSPFDSQIGKFLASLAANHDPCVALAGQFVSRQLRDGHVCLNLREIAGRSIITVENPEQSIQCPELSVWLQSLKNARCVGQPGDFKPLILDAQDRLYFQRYWQYEQDIAKFIMSRMDRPPEIVDSVKNLRETFLSYFPVSEETVNWTGLAAAAACLKHFLVITGPPGTGKTSAITRILAFLMDVRGRQLRIALCAPTGKASSRLEESVKRAKLSLTCPDEIKNAIPEEAMTIHRMLGSVRHSPYFRYNEKKPLPYDVVIVDESSMVDLPLAAKLMTALAPGAQLIWLGDKDQLASVEAGAVLGSICFPEPLNVYSGKFGQQLARIWGRLPAISKSAEGVSDCIVELRHNYRFTRESGIGLLSQAVRSGNIEDALKLVHNEKYADIRYHEVIRINQIAEMLADLVSEHYQKYVEAALSADRNVESVFDLFDSFRVLCAMRVGTWGALRINALIERILSERGLINPSFYHYEGRPVIIVQNDYRKNLFNGDIGLILKDASDNDRLKVFFRDRKKNIRKMAPERLPPHETVWAMTVHKSQGSEFNQIALILSDADSPVLTRELLYTGITRARFGVNIWAGPEILAKTIPKQIIRESGLTDALRTAT